MLAGNPRPKVCALTSQTVHPFQSLPPHWSQCLLLQPPLPPPGVLVGGLCVEEGRLGGGGEGRRVVDSDGIRDVDGDGLGDVEGDGLEDVAGREGLGIGRVVLGLGTGGGFDGRGGLVPPSVGVLTWLPSQ
jgi:hypothetical protein